MAMRSYLSIITLHVNGLNAPTFETGVLEEEDKKKDHEKILEEIIVENSLKWGRK